jgi:hypothetical protein
MKFKNYIETAKELSESAQLKLELITKIGALLGLAELSDLKKILKILENEKEGTK